MLNLPLSVLSQITATLEQENIPYALVGSFASSIHGMYRSTADIDILARIEPEQVHTLFEALRNSFYLDEHSMHNAVAHQSSFNAIHFDSVFKVDIFTRRFDEFALTQLNRRQSRRISPDREEFVYVASAEDTILAKLQWYRSGRETSNTQWNDVLGVLATSRSTLDYEYLRMWADKLDLTDLLRKALDDVQEDSSI